MPLPNIFPTLTVVLPPDMTQNEFSALCKELSRHRNVGVFAGDMNKAEWGQRQALNAAIYKAKLKGSALGPI